MQASHGACMVLSPPASQAAAYRLRSAQSVFLFDIAQRVTILAGVFAKGERTSHRGNCAKRCNKKASGLCSISVELDA